MSSRRPGRRRLALVALATVTALTAASCSSPLDRAAVTDHATTTATSQPGATTTTSRALEPAGPPVHPADGATCPRPTAVTDTSVTIGLERIAAGGDVVTFGVPLPHGALADGADVWVTAAGARVDATVRPLLREHDATGQATGVRSVQVQVPASVVAGDCGEVEVAWAGSGEPARRSETELVPFEQVSTEAKEVVTTAKRTIEEKDGVASLAETSRDERVLFTAREPNVLATYPDGYLARTGILGRQVSASQIPKDLAGLKFLSDQMTPFGLSAMYREPFALNPVAVVGPADPDSDSGPGYEAWLYDRCATFLEFAVQTGDLRFEREGMRTCSYYAGKIALDGPDRGIFTGKPEPDPKYSHLRGLYAYYALTGDQAALAAGTAIADLWLHDDLFVAPYRSGHLRGPDKLWTERLLGTSIEGLYYGHQLTGDRDDLDAVRQLVDTGYRHVTGDAAALAELNPGTPAFPPQNCFVHTASQHDEGDDDQPWCSGWMSELLVDPLLAYQEQTGDPHVDEIFIRLVRFLRDTGSSYLLGDLQDDDFLHPSVAYDVNEPEVKDRRVLVPLYGAGIDANGKRRTDGEDDDVNHCLDATALTAAGLRALRRTDGFDRNPIGPFASEGESFLALHDELAFCAFTVLLDQTRPHRDPATFTADQLRDGLGDPDAFIADHKIGYPTHNTAPQRKVSWWFNTVFEQFALLQDAGVRLPELTPGTVQP